MESLIALLTEPTAWVALITLVVMEIVLGIDNLVFVSLISNKVAPEHRRKAERIGLGLAMGMRLALVGAIAWVVTLTQPVFTAFGHGYSIKDLILIGGGLFLIWKATKEIHHTVAPDDDDALSGGPSKTLGLAAAVANIFFINIVFSLDSIITAIGMTTSVPIMVISVVAAVGVMLVAAGPLGTFISRNPTVVMLALSFLLLIGTTLIADGMGFHVPKEYVYVAMAFSGLVEVLNMLSRRKRRKAV